MATIHRNLTGADLHEPKGADSALSGQVYVSDGAGSGSWVDASTIITNTAFTTGDLKITHKASADTGWILWQEGSIGDGSSSATLRANADCEDLFLMYWNGYSNTLCPVSSGRGASAAADWASHKRLTLPAGNGRALGLAGAGTSLTTRTVGSAVGAETFTLATINLPPYTPTGVVSTSVSPGGTYVVGSTSGTVVNGAGVTVPLGNTTPLYTANSTFFGDAQGGSSTPKDMMNPTTYVNVMIKL
jgi:hypothetical protein